MKKILLATLILIQSSTAYAQVINCDGVYGNLPCDQRQAGKPAEAAAVSDPISGDSKKAMSQKKTLTHDLAMKIIKYNKDYKLNYSTQVVEDFCLKPETSLSDCSEKVDELSEKVETRVASLETISAQKKANELSEQKLQAEKEGEKNITIIRQPIYVVRATPTYYPRPGVGYGIEVDLQDKHGNKVKIKDQEVFRPGYGGGKLYERQDVIRNDSIKPNKSRSEIIKVK